MYEKLAWDNFCKTGDIESFLEYKKITEIKNNNLDLSNIDIEEKGEYFSEFDKNKSGCDKGSNI